MTAPIQPLSRWVRVSLWWVLVVVFVVGTPILIGYSKGYRLDDALLLIQTGGVYIHSDIANTLVYLDGEFVEENGTLLRNTLVQDLVPNKVYEIWVQKDGYQSWVKKLKVEPNLVTEARVMMLPELFEWTVIEASTTVSVLDDSASTTSSSRSTSTQEVSNPRYEELVEYFAEDDDQFVINVASTTYEIVRGKRVATTTTVREPDFPRWLEDIASSTGLYAKNDVRERDGIVTWLLDGDVHAIWARTSDAPPYYFCNATCTPEVIVEWGDDIRHYDFYPNRNDVVIVDTGNAIYAVELDDRSQRNIQTIYEGRVEDFRFLQNGNLIVFDGAVFRETSW